MHRLHITFFTMLIILISVLAVPAFGEVYQCETHKIPVYLKNTITGGKITYICQDESTGTIEIMLDAQQSGKITLEIPRSVADPRKTDCSDDRFLIMEHRYMDGDPWVNAIYTEKSTTEARTLTIHFEAFSSYLTITGSKGLMNKITGENCDTLSTVNPNQNNTNKNNDSSKATKTKQCKSGLVNIQKPTGWNICVKPDTAKILLERWDGKITVQRIDTKCSDPWDNNERAYQLADEYMRDHPDYDNLNIDDRFALQTSVFEKFIEEKGIQIFNITLKADAAVPDTCNECDCNTGGHAWQLVVSKKDLTKIKDLGFELVK